MTSSDTFMADGSSRRAVTHTATSFSDVSGIEFLGHTHGAIFPARRSKRIIDTWINVQGRFVPHSIRRRGLNEELYIKHMEFLHDILMHAHKIQPSGFPARSHNYKHYGVETVNDTYHMFYSLSTISLITLMEQLQKVLGSPETGNNARYKWSELGLSDGLDVGTEGSFRQFGEYVWASEVVQDSTSRTPTSSSNLSNVSLSTKELDPGAGASDKLPISECAQHRCASYSVQFTAHCPLGSVPNGEKMVCLLPVEIRTFYEFSKELFDKGLAAGDFQVGDLEGPLSYDVKIPVAEMSEDMAQRACCTLITQAFSDMILSHQPFRLMTNGQDYAILEITFDENREATCWYWCFGHNDLMDIDPDKLPGDCQKDKNSYRTALARIIFTIFESASRGRVSKMGRSFVDFVNQHADDKRNCFSKNNKKRKRGEQDSVEHGLRRSSGNNHGLPTASHQMQTECLHSPASSSADHKEPRNDNAHEESTSPTDISVSTSRAVDPFETLQFCSQECLLSLRLREPADPACPNFSRHFPDATVESRHKITVEDLFTSLKKQFLNSFDESFERIARGATGVVFAIIDPDYGYVCVGKTVKRCHIKRLEKEARFYEHLLPLQGEGIPVSLGIVQFGWKNDNPEAAFDYTMFLILSWAGNDVTDESSSSAERLELEEALRQHDVEHLDAEVYNFVRHPATERLSLIDFERARMIQEED